MTGARVAAAAAGVVLLTITELAAFLLLANQIGGGLTLLLVLGASLAGVLLLAREGVRAWRGFRSALRAGRPPGHEVIDGVVGMTGALLLASPGLVTGVTGALMLIPPVRGLARRGLQTATERRLPYAREMFGPRRVRVYQHPPAESPASEPSDVIDGEIVDDY